MPRTFIPLLGLVFSFLLMMALSQAQESSSPPPVVTIGLADNFAPYMFRGIEGKPEGLMVEVIQALMEATGIQATFHQMAWSEAKQLFRDGQIQILVGYAYSHERDTWADFSQPILTQRYGIFTRDGIESAKSIEALHGKPLLVPGGTAIEDLLREEEVANELVPVSDSMDALYLLASGRYDHAIIPWTLGELLLNQEGLARISAVSPPNLSVDRCFAVKAENSALLDTLNEGLQHLRISGQMRNIQVKWLGEKDQPDLSHRLFIYYFTILVGLAAFIILLMVLWSTSLRRQVKNQTEALQNKLTERIQAEEESARARWFLRATIDSLHSHIAILNAEGDIVETNSTWHEFAEINLPGGINYSIGTNFLKVCDETEGEDREDTSRISEGIRAVQSGSSPFFFMEYSSHLPTGTIWFNLRVTRFEANDTFYLVLSFTNTTDRRRIQDDLRASEKKYRSLVENIPGVAWTTGQFDEILFVSPVIKQILGYTSQEILEKPLSEWFDRIHPDDCERVRKAHNDLFESKISFGFDEEFRIQSRDGRWIWVQNHSGIPYLNNGIRCVDGVMTDITGRKLASEKILFQADLLEHIGDLITATDLQGNITYVNDAECRLFGKSRGEFIGQPVSSFGEDPDRGSPQQEIISSTREKGEWTGEVVNYDKDGNEHILECRTWLVRDERGNPVGLCGVSTDITERKRTEAERLRLVAQLNQAQKLESLGVLAGGIAHDFNNILSAVLGFTHLSLKDLPDESPAQAHIQEVHKAAMRAKELVDQILTFSRSAEEERHPIDLHSVALETLKLLRASTPATIQILPLVHTQPGYVMANSGQIHQVFMNLCTNAVHAMEETGGILEMGLECVTLDDSRSIPVTDLKPGEYIRIRIRDTGHGIRKEIIDRIFDPFFTTKQQGKGTGLGLSVVHGIVRNHGGAVVVQSEQGIGTLFEVYLPRVETQPAQVAPPAVPSPSQGTRILFLDDECMIVKMGKDLLEREGYLVTGETSPLSALERLRNSGEVFDLIITDYTMPGMTGIDFLHELRKDLHLSPPAILTTGHSDPLTPGIEEQLDIRRILRKPALPEQMVEAIEEALHRM